MSAVVAACANSGGMTWEASSAKFAQEIGGPAAEYCQIEKVDPRLRGAKPVTRDGKVVPNLFRVEVRDFFRVYQVQNDEETCWAAAAAMILRHHGDAMDQRQLAAYFAAGQEDKSVDEDKIARALSYQHERELSSIVWRPKIRGEPIGCDECIAAINAQEPILVGVKEDPSDESGHVLVVNAVTFRWRGPPTVDFWTKKPRPTWDVVSFETFDPYMRGTEPVRVLDADAVRSKVVFAMTRRTADAAVRNCIANARRSR